MRLLLDTNVVVSAVLFGGSPQRLVDAAFRGAFDLVTSEALLDELESVLREKFDRPPGIAHAIREELAAVADVRRPGQIPSVVRDPADDMVVAAALDGRADGIVTGDNDLLALGAYAGITILTVAQALSALTIDDSRPP